MTRIAGAIRWLVAFAGVTSVASAALVAWAPAAAGSPQPTSAWEVNVVPRPSAFSSSDTAPCEANESLTFGRFHPCDGYTVIARNSGDAPASGPITVSDTLPSAGVAAVYVAGIELQRGAFGPNAMECPEPPLGGNIACTYGATVPPDGVLVMQVNVIDLGVSANGTDRATIEGAGSTQSASTTNRLDADTPAFGLDDYNLAVTSADGMPETVAGGHPYELTARLDFATDIQPQSGQINELGDGPINEPRDIVAYLPPGTIGDPQAVEACPEAAFLASVHQTACPKGSMVGVVTADVAGTYLASSVVSDATSAVYNLKAPPGFAAEFGFTLLGNPLVMFAQLVWHEGQYRLRVSTTSLPPEPLLGLSLTFFGNPSEKSAAGPVQAFLRNPTRCTGEPLSSLIETDSAEEPHRWATAESAGYARVDGCDELQFDPEVTVTPETSISDTPSGLEVTIKTRQAANVPGLTATPDLKNATVNLPAGVSISPAAGAHLTGCPESGPNGIDLPQGTTHPDEAGEGEEIGPDGLSRPSAGHCPARSSIGQVEIATPLLAQPLKGNLFVGEPLCGGVEQRPCTAASAADGELFRLYLEAARSGVIVKLKGVAKVDPTSGQVTVQFEENPQLPFERLQVKLDGGPSGPLANPQTCGAALTSSTLEPWGGPPATSNSQYQVTGCSGYGPFAPSFMAGSVSPVAGGYSAVTLAFARRDGESNLVGAIVHLPRGLLAKIAAVSLCDTPQAAAGTCPAASRIGTATVAAGSGSEPLWLAGPVYLTGPYNGAPYGLSIVVPAKAGPFNLGNEVVRASISVDSVSAALTVASDPLPQIKDGVPFRLKTINVTIDRPSFMFNPTNCTQQQVTATIGGAMPDGSGRRSVPVSAPFAVAGCRNLPFKPRFSVLTQAHTSKALGASLHVNVTSGPGQANIGKVKVDLPKQLPSRLSTLQKACPDATFAANPASCPAGSLVGTGTAVTPVLKAPLTGPAYLVSHAGAAFPDLVIVLQGEGITLDLVGNTDIKKGITISSFNSVPDAPISTFDLVLPEGPHSALGAIANLCRTRLNMPTLITGQNGAVIRQTTRIAVSGCPKHKQAKRHKTHRKTARHGRR